MISRLIRLVLALLVSTATIERVFSAMKFIKTPFRNKMESEFLSDCIIIYIEKEFVDIINSYSIIDKFNSRKYRKTQLKYSLIVIELFLKFDVFSYILLKFSLSFMFLVGITFGLGKKNLAHPKIFFCLRPRLWESSKWTFHPPSSSK